MKTCVFGKFKIPEKILLIDTLLSMLYFIALVFARYLSMQEYTNNQFRYGFDFLYISLQYVEYSKEKKNLLIILTVNTRDTQLMNIYTSVGYNNIQTGSKGSV